MTAAKAGIGFTQFILCLEVFCELGLLKADYRDFFVKVNSGLKVELAGSAILRHIEQMIKRN